MRKGGGLVALAAWAAWSAGCHAPARPPEGRPGAVHAADPRPLQDAEALPGLELLRTEPADGSEIGPLQTIVLVFDRPVEPSTLVEGAVRGEYVGSRRRFVEDPFLHVAPELFQEGDGRELRFRPRLFLPGETVHLTVTSRLRGVDGTRLGRAPVTLTFRVRELPAP